MRINEDTLLEGSKVVLVPYNAEHVPRYQHLSKNHDWTEHPLYLPLTSIIIRFNNRYMYSFYIFRSC